MMTGPKEIRLRPTPREEAERVSCTLRMFVRRGRVKDGCVGERREAWRREQEKTEEKKPQRRVRTRRVPQFEPNGARRVADVRGRRADDEVAERAVCSVYLNAGTHGHGRLWLRLSRRARDGIWSV